MTAEKTYNVGIYCRVEIELPLSGGQSFRREDLYAEIAEMVWKTIKIKFFQLILIKIAFSRFESGRTLSFFMLILQGIFPEFGQIWLNSAK